MQTVDDILDQPIAMADSEKKKGKAKIQEFEYLENGKSFLNGIKTIVHSF